MTQTSEPGIKSEHGEGERTRENGEQSTNAERHAISDNSEHLRFAIADLEANFGPRFCSAFAWNRRAHRQVGHGTATQGRVG
jgi:hypothetical protein